MQGNEQATNLLNAKATTAKTKSVVANSVKLNPENPIPLTFGSDAFSVVTGKRYMPFLGMWDQMANLFWEARSQSTTQNACISTIAQTCVGKGIYVKNVDPDKVDPDFLKWIKKCNNDNESLNELCRQALDGLLTDGNGWINVVKGNFGSQKYVKPYFHTTLYCRLGAADPKTGEINSVIKSDLLAHPREGMMTARGLKATQFPLYSDNELDQKKAWKDVNDNGDMHSMIHMKSKFGAVKHYGMPRSMSSLRYQVQEAKTAQYNIDNLENGMVMSGLLIFKSSMTDTEAQKVGKNIIHTHTGMGKTGRTAVISSEGGIDDFTYQQLQTKQDGSFIELDTLAVSKIISAHQWDPLLAGLPDKTNALGKGSTYIRAIFDIKKAIVLEPLEEYMLTNLIYPLVRIAATHLGKKDWLGYELGLQMSPPYSLISDIEVNNVLTKDEGREIIGKGPMKDPTIGGSIIGTRITETETYPSPKPIL